MPDTRARLLTVSDFNTDNFAALMSNSDEAPLVEAIAAPFGQPHQLLLNGDAEAWRRRPDIVVVWTRPQVIHGFDLALNAEPFAVEHVLEEVDAFASLVLQAAGRTRTVLAPTWVLPPYERGFGLLDHRQGLGLRDLLLRMNLRLAERLAERPNCFVLDAQRWMQRAGQRAVNPKLWYMGKIAFGNDVFAAAAADVKAALRAVAGEARKLVILDLDDTLWGGVVGEVGWEQLILGGHDGEGEALVDFQHALKALSRRGVLLGVVSKNDEAVALEAMRRHPEMVLRPDDLAGWRINWNDKAQNVADLAAELNLGLQSVLFIDDNPAERARVRDALPEVLVPEWPADRMLYRQALAELTCFDTAAVTEEDRQRAAMYVAQRRRKDTLQSVGSLDEWLKTLEMVVRIEPLSTQNLPRAAQLLNKTNQMNLRTRRMGEAELLAWSQEPGRRVWAIRVADKLGDMGLTGLMSLERDGSAAHLPDLLLSCRVMGRKIEHLMLALAAREAGRMNLGRVEARYQPTAKNGPCLTALGQCGWDYDEASQVFSWDTGKAYPFPPHLRVEEST